MPELIIVCGLMGCGKTTLSKSMARRMGYVYIDFDDEYHFKIQKEKSIDILIQSQRENLLKKIADDLNRNPKKNYVLDGFFKWKTYWWEDKGYDNSLERLQKMLRHHEMTILHMFVPFSVTYKRYIVKHRKDFKPKYDYRGTMRERQEALIRRIAGSKWVTR